MFAAIAGCGFFLGLPGLGSPAAATTEVIELIQDRSVIQHHQRLVGNVRAQARREGVVVNVPQLYVYHADHSEAYHMDGHRPGFIRELNLIIQRQRRSRTMVALDKLLERAGTADGEPIAPRQLPEAGVILMLYYRANCPDCRRVTEDLQRWLDENPDLDALWIRVSMDRVVVPDLRE